MNKKLIICAGHNPKTDSGALGKGFKEADINVKICQRIKKYMTDWKFPISYVPDDIGDLPTEVAWVNKRNNVNSGYALQVHLNAGGGTGSEFWYPSHGDATSKKIAKLVLDELCKATGLKNRGIKDSSTSRFGRFGWCDDTKPYAGMAECWFIDKDKTTDGRIDLAAYGICVGFCKYFGHPYGKSYTQLAKEANSAADEAKKLAEAKAKAEAEAKALAEAQKAAQEAAKLKAEQEAIAAEKARIEAEKARIEAEKQAAIEHASDHTFIRVLKELWNLIADFFSKKGKQ